MEDSVAQLGTFRAGRIAGRVWKIVSFDEHGAIRAVDYEVELLNGPPIGCVQMSLLEVPDLISVLGQALNSAKDNADDATKSNLVELLRATSDAPSSGN